MWHDCEIYLTQALASHFYDAGAQESRSEGISKRFELVCHEAAAHPDVFMLHDS